MKNLGEGREGKARKGKGREGKEREGKGKEEKGREGEGRARKEREEKGMNGKMVMLMRRIGSRCFELCSVSALR